MPKINDICHCDAKTDSGDEFVGIRCIKANDGKYETRIDFPMGYFKDDAAIRTLPEETVRESVMNLFSVLTDADLLSKIREDSSIAAISEEAKETTFPMLAYLNVIRNYLDNGYITEREVEYKRKAHGKVNWNRTIKMTKPIVDEDESNLVYLDLIARKVNYNEDCLITLVHKFCVHDALNRLGFLFGIEPTEEPILDFEYELFCSAVNAKLSKTFNDRDLHLLSDLAKIIEFLAEHRTEDGINSEYYFGVNKFAPVWEALIDRIFGTVSRKERNDKYNPHLKYVAENAANSEGDAYQEEVDSNAEYKRSTLRPDTIMVTEIPEQVGDDKVGVFILDSKYYKFGVVDENFDRKRFLPGAESVCKQMAYAEYVETRWKKIFSLDSSNAVHSQNDDCATSFAGMTSNNIYNAFIMPYCADAVDSIASLQNDGGATPFGMKFEGFIYGDWKDGKKPYHKIACILLDVKSVMQNYAADPNAQDELAKLISR